MSVTATVDPALRATAFWYLRHGETDWNAQNLAQGNVDTHLNERGLQQARDAAALLRGRGIVSLVASPFRRAHQTAVIVAEALGLPIETETDLHEVVFGSMEGKPMLAAWFDDWVAEKSTPEGAETFAALRTRAVGAVNRALERPAPVLVIAHGALFRSLRSAMGLAPNVRLANATPMWCEPPATPGEAWTLTTA